MSPFKDDYDQFVQISNDCNGAWTKMPRRISARMKENTHLDEENDMTLDLRPVVGADRTTAGSGVAVTTATPWHANNGRSRAGDSVVSDLVSCQFSKDTGASRLP